MTTFTHGIPQWMRAERGRADPNPLPRLVLFPRLSRCLRWFR